ncbi:flavin reductase domain protein FMN-binding [Methanococcus vannielii SB]|uniref:Flavin reductase domain protein FMN-binding n=1 Tax=Methanococcus vannielii (strain ATCC 35089 / DSM 1224 / JCM 13029 / OCM 148 / SB) TaxID=406327 RepID=A6UN44_METVS|nr:flavin reductase family protein [Methanococcus vannielii]ABR53916.1 flavin reductase domain protein FMN-binding [Methanococcus vannielii SB]
MDKKALKKISYGLYVVSSVKNNKYNGQIANSVFQVASDPALILVSINKTNFTHECIIESKKFTVSVLSKNTDFMFIGLFGFKSGKDIDKFENVKFKLSKSNIPILLENSIAWLDCEVIDTFDAKTHSLFIGKLTDSDVLNDQEPLTYDYYQNVIKGNTPKTATTYIKDDFK